MISLLIAVLGIILFLLLLKLFFKALKVFIVVNLILLIVFGGLAFLVVRDASNFKQRFSSEKNLFLLEDNGSIIAGFVYAGSSRPSFIDENSLNKINGLSEITLSDAESALSTSLYKVFIVSSREFNSSDFSIELLAGHPTPLPVIMGSLRSHPVEAFLNYYSSQGLDKSAVNLSLTHFMQEYGLNSEAQVKGMLFSALIAKDFNDNGALFLVRGIKERTIRVVPMSPLFVVLKYVNAESLISRVSPKSKGVSPGN